MAAWAILAGLILGYCVMLSYGLPLLGILAVAILVLARRWTPLPWAAGAAVLVVLAFAASGFAWWEAYPVLVERYWAGVASNRPFPYWVWANLAALAFSAGPLVGAGLAVAVQRVRRSQIGGLAQDVVVVALALAALAHRAARRSLGDEQGRGRTHLAAVRALAARRHGTALGPVASLGARRAARIRARRAAPARHRLVIEGPAARRRMRGMTRGGRNPDSPARVQFVTVGSRTIRR